MIEFAPRGSEFVSSRAVPFGVETHFNHIRLPPLNATIFILHVRTIVFPGLK